VAFFFFIFFFAIAINSSIGAGRPVKWNSIIALSFGSYFFSLLLKDQDLKSSSYICKKQLSHQSVQLMNADARYELVR